jgi:hypothetical protein
MARLTEFHHQQPSCAAAAIPAADCRASSGCSLHLSFMLKIEEGGGARAVSESASTVAATHCSEGDREEVRALHPLHPVLPLLS